jgi:hypothetical protein
MLLYQMLPEAVATQLKLNKNVSAGLEYTGQGHRVTI